MKRIATLIVLLLLVIACKQSQKTPEDNTIVIPEAEKPLEWIQLFDGKTFDGWHIYNGGDIHKHWRIDNGALIFNGRKEGAEANLVTDKDYTNFKLSLEWKISEGGNSGIMWSVVEEETYEHPYNTGPEIQILDNAKHSDGKYPSHHAGALYDMVVPPNNVAKVGEWNTCEIYINHKTNEGKSVLNGVVMAEFPVHGEAWDAMVANSKFKDWAAFGTSKTGKICLQDHNDKVWYRNIKIKALD